MGKCSPIPLQELDALCSVFALLRVDQSADLANTEYVSDSFSHVLVQPVSVHFVGDPAHAHKIMFGK